MTATRGLIKTPPSRTPLRPLDVAAVRQDFPILRTLVHGRPLVYLDNAATSQKPQPVIDAIDEFNAHRNANVHRGVHYLSQQATAEYDGVRERVRRFFNAASPSEIIFTAGTTASINLVAQSYGRTVLRPGDEILLTEMEHHSNIVPWQLIREQTGAVIRVIPLTDEGELRLDGLDGLINDRTRIVALAHGSNVLGTINPVRQVADLAHARGAVVVVDGAQSAPHLTVDVQALGCDFFACSAHKMLGPTGVGVLYGRSDLLERMPPWQGGGGMIATVSFERTTFAPSPMRFEAGTPPIAEVIGLGVAVEYLQRIGLESIGAHEANLLQYATEQIAEVPGVRLIGTGRDKVAVLSFVMDVAHPHDIGTVLDHDGIAIRAGHHCAQPLMKRFGVPATARASFALYNTREEVDALVAGLLKVRKVFG